MRSQREVVVLVPRESCQVEDDDELDGSLVRAAELQHLLDLGAIGGLGALALLAASREHLEGLAFAVSQAFSCVGRLRFSVCSLVLTRTEMSAPTMSGSIDAPSGHRKFVRMHERRDLDRAVSRAARRRSD